MKKRWMASVLETSREAEVVLPFNRKRRAAARIEASAPAKTNQSA